MCYDIRDDRLYVACSGPYEAVAISGAGDTVVARIPGPHTPVAIGWNSTDNKIYLVAHRPLSDAGSVVVIDAATNTVRARVWANGDPTAVLHNPANGHVYFPLLDGDSVLVMDGASDSVLKRIPTGRGPDELCLDPHDNRIYSANSYSHSVTAIDCIRDSVVATIWFGSSGPSGLSYNALNNTVYCAFFSGNNVRVIDCSDNVTVAGLNLDAGPRNLTFDPSHNRTFVAQYQGPGIYVLRDSVPVVAQPVLPDRAHVFPAVSPIIAGNTIRLQFSRRVKSTVQIRDATGRTRLSYQVPPGVLSVDLDAHSLANGVYFLTAPPDIIQGRRFVLNR